MITDLIKILHSQEWENVSESVDIAKGKYQYPRTFGEVWKWFKKEMKWRK